MTTLAYIGNALDAAGWRLAGAVTYTPGPLAARQALAEARRSAAIVLVSTAVARGLPAAELEAALVALQPLVVVLPDEDGGAPLSVDPAERVRRQLGLDAEAPAAEAAIGAEADPR